MTHFFYMILLAGLITVPVCVLLQIYIWFSWRGYWRLIGTFPALSLVAGCAHGWLKESNLWPFWITEFAPFVLCVGVVLMILHRRLRDVGDSTPNAQAEPPPNCSYEERLKYYSLADLDSVKQGIDKSRFPDRYQLVITEIEKRMKK